MKDTELELFTEALKGIINEADRMTNNTRSNGCTITAFLIILPAPLFHASILPPYCFRNISQINKTETFQNNF